MLLDTRWCIGVGCRSVETALEATGMGIVVGRRYWRDRMDDSSAAEAYREAVGMMGWENRRCGQAASGSAIHVKRALRPH